MKLAFLFARRYVFGKKTTNAINVITGVTITGVALGTAALVIIMSIFNGFGDLVGNLFNAFNPDIKITALKGKGFEISDDVYSQLKAVPGVKAMARTMEEKALLEYRDVQDVGTLKGVDPSFNKVTTIDSTIREGYLDLSPEGPHRAIVGAGLRRRMSINVADFFTQLKVYMPKKTSSISVDKPFTSRSIQPTGIFSFQQEYDYEYIIAPLSFLQSITGRDDIGAIEMSVVDRAELPRIKADLEEILGPELLIADRYEQDAEFLRLMQIEKWIGFAITSLTLIILSFTIIGALWMIVLDKKLDIAIMRSMGSSSSDIYKMFFTTGMTITGVGLILGLAIAVIFYFLQKQFGIIGIPDGFIVDSYPIDMQAFDVLMAILTVLLIGGLASWIPARKAAGMEDLVRIEG